MGERRRREGGTRAPLHRVLDFGVGAEELARIGARPAPKLAQIARMIVDEEDLSRLGRWAGAPAPERRRPGR